MRAKPKLVQARPLVPKNETVHYEVTQFVAPFCKRFFDSPKHVCIHLDKQKPSYDSRSNTRHIPSWFTFKRNMALM